MLLQITNCLNGWNSFQREKLKIKHLSSQCNSEEEADRQHSLEGTGLFCFYFQGSIQTNRVHHCIFIHTQHFLMCSYSYSSIRPSSMAHSLASSPSSPSQPPFCLPIAYIILPSLFPTSLKISSSALISLSSFFFTLHVYIHTNTLIFTQT